MDFANFLEWAVRHIGDLPELLNRAEAIFSADSIEAKWDAFKSFGDLFVPIASDFPLEKSQLSLQEYDSMSHFQVAGKIDVELLIRLWLILRPIIPIFLDVINNDSDG